MPFNTREAVPPDVEAIFHIRTSVKENHLSREALTALGITADSVGQAIAEHQGIWVASIQEQLIGFAMIDQEEACLFALFVLPEWEGQGVGHALLQQAEHALFQHHETIWLETASNSRAAQFYIRHGWQRQRIATDPNLLLAQDNSANSDWRLKKRRSLP